MTSPLNRHTATQLTGSVTAMLIVMGQVFAQGTATGPATSHPVEPGPIVNIGSLVDPVPIDLDPTGPPWSKGIFDPNILLGSGGPLTMVETIINVGDEAWYDWHEHILNPPAGLPQAYWDDVLSMTVNGNPITFNSMGIGTPDLWLDTFSQPVLPGEVLVIEKVAFVEPNSAGITGEPLMRIIEYPTPEPTTFLLMGIGALGIICPRRPRA